MRRAAGPVDLQRALQRAHALRPRPPVAVRIHPRSDHSRIVALTGAGSSGLRLEETTAMPTGCAVIVDASGGIILFIALRSSSS